MVHLPKRTLKSPIFFLLFSFTAAPAIYGSGGLFISKYGSAEAAPFIIGILALGVLLGLLAYNLFLAVTTREPMFVYFSAIMLLLSILQTFSTYDRFFFYLTYNRVTLITHTLFITLLLFFQDFFQIPRQNRSLSSWNRGSVLVILVYTLLFLLLKGLTPGAGGFHGGLDFVRELFVFYTNALFIANIVIAMRWMKTEAVLILVAFIPPALLTSLNAMNIFPFMDRYQGFTTMMTQYNQPIGLSLQAILLSLAVGNRYNRIKAERLKSADERDRLKILDKEKTECYMNLSHELRTPLTIILGLTEQLKGGKFGDSIHKNRKTLEMLERNGKRLLKQINAMLKIENPETATSPLFLRVDSQIRAYVEEFQPIAKERGLTLAYQTNEHLKSAALSVRPEDFDSLVLNLLSNAVKYTPRGGRISLEIEATPSGDFKIAVKDTGPGVPGELKDKIFERFKSFGDTVSGGAGLGLPVVRKIMRSYGGEVCLSEAKSGGSVFSLVFPADRFVNQYLGETPLPSREDLGIYTAEFGIETLETDTHNDTGPVLLIVEDDPDMVQYLCSILSQNYRLLTAPGGREALKILACNSVDMIISDVMMKGLDGHEFYREFRGAFPDSTVPFLFLTARDSLEEKIRSLEDGAVHYITKPFNPGELLALTESTLTRERQLISKNISSIRREIDDLLNNLEGAPRRADLSRVVPEKVVRDYGLSGREGEVLELILKGLPDKEIAAALRLSPSTVANHNRKIYQKLGVKSRVEAVARFT